MVIDNSMIPLPVEWSSLTAASTRWECMWNLYEIANWDNRDSPDVIERDFASYANFFLDDFMYKDNPTSMIGQSLHPDELEYVEPFIVVFEEMYNNIDEKRKYGQIDKLDFPMTLPVIYRAKDLYDAMIKNGDPCIAKHYRNF